MSQRLVHAALLGVLCLCGLASGVAAAAPRNAVVVLSPTGGESLSVEALQSLEETLLASLPADELQVLGMRDVRQLLGFEQQKQLLGCDDDGCIAEVAGALGVRFLVASDVGRVGNAWIINAKALDAHGARVLARASRTCDAPEELLTAVPSVAREVGRRLVEVVRAEQPPPPPWRKEVAVRAGMSGLTGVLGLGVGVQIGWVGVGVGTGTHLLSGGVSVARPGGGPYLDLHAVLARTGPLLLPTGREVSPGIGAGASVGWDLRPVAGLSLKLGLGAAHDSARDGGFLLLDAAVGYVHELGAAVPGNQGAAR